MSVQQVLIDGVWSASQGNKTFHAVNPATKQSLPQIFPISPWHEVESAITAAAEASRLVRNWHGERFARFLERYAERLEQTSADLIAMANLETGLPVEPRLAKAEFPRTVNQLKQAATAARDGSWALATIDTSANIRSMFGPLGPVCVFGPNNFPFAFNSIAGGDFAAAVAAGNPVIAKAHSSHPETTRLFAEQAWHAARETQMPSGFVQLIYRIDHADGERLVSHPLIGATGYTGAREAGLTLKAAADRAGKPIYLELSSINPVVILPGAFRERLPALVDEFSTSCLMGAGQFCTNPGLVLLLTGAETDSFIDQVRAKFDAATPGTLLGEGVLKHLTHGVNALQAAGAHVVAGGKPVDGGRYAFQNTILRSTGEAFLKNPHALQTEAFGNASLFVVCRDIDQLAQVIKSLEGNLTGSIYSATDGADDALERQIAPALRQKVGRLINDAMPTGVAVSPAMNHGGPFPATGHPGFTAVGIPASMLRFGMLHCYDRVRQKRLPPALQDKNPTGKLWRCINGQWTQADVSPPA